MDQTVQTREIEFSLCGRRPVDVRIYANRICAANSAHGLTVDQRYSCDNGGVALGLKFTGPAWLLDKIKKKYGY